MSSSTLKILSIALSTLSLLENAAAQTTNIVDWPVSTVTTLGYTFRELIPPSTYSSYSLPTPLNCPEGYGTYQGVICLAPNTGYSVQAPSSPPPSVQTTTIEKLSEIAVGSTSIATFVPFVTTITNAELYCPPPYVLIGGACYIASEIASIKSGWSAMDAIYSSTHTQGIPVATLTTLGETITYYSTPYISGPRTSPTPGGASATITTAGITVTLYTPPVLPTVSGETTMTTQASTTTALVSQSSDGQIEATTAAASASVTPFEGGAAKPTGSITVIMAVVVAALGAGIIVVL